MKTIKLSFLFIVFFIVLLFSMSCASVDTDKLESDGTSSVVAETTEQVVVAAPSVQAEKIPVQVAEEITEATDEMILPTKSIARVIENKRFVTYADVPRYGDYLIISNDTGFSLAQIDIFTEAMYRSSDTMENLINDMPLEEGGQRIVKLQEYPELYEALLAKDDSIYIVNAIDTDGDYYVYTWNPATDPWDVVIPFDAYHHAFERPQIPSFGDQIIISNSTANSLEKLYIEIQSLEGDDVSMVNILDTMLLAPAMTIEISISDMPWVSDQLGENASEIVIITAFAADGTMYQKYWYPAYDNWYIEFTSYDMVLSQGNLSGPHVLEIENTTDTHIWYVHLVTKDMLDSQVYGEDMLDMTTVLETGQTLMFDLSQHELFPIFLSVVPTEPLYLVGIDASGDAYHLPWDPNTDEWNVRFENSHLFVGSRPEATYDYSPLRLINNTGNDIWFVYLATEEMRSGNDEGSDVLKDQLLFDGEWVDIIPESFQWVRDELITNPEASLYVTAYSYDDTMYEFKWAPSIDGWEIVIHGAVEAVE